MGASAVQAWRNTLKARPPPLSKEDPYYPGNDRRYADLSEEQIPLSESLLDTMKRTIPLWEYKIKRDIAKGNNVLVVGHGNTLRGLLKVIDDVNDVEIQEVNLPRGIPAVYNFDSKLRPQPAGKKLSQLHTNAIFLEKPGLLQTAMKQQNKWKTMVPGLDEGQVRQQVARDQNTVDALEQLRAEQQAEIAITGAGEAALKAEPTMEIQASAGHERWDDDPSEFEDWDEFSGDDFGDRQSFFNWVPSASTSVSSQERADPSKFKEGDPVVVFIRHGRTPHNNLGCKCCHIFMVMIPQTATYSFTDSFKPSIYRMGGSTACSRRCRRCKTSWSRIEAAWLPFRRHVHELVGSCDSNRHVRPGRARFSLDSCCQIMATE